MPLSVTRVVNALLCSDELYCPLHQSGAAVAGATNAVYTKQSEAVTVSLFFPPPHPTLLTPSPLPTGSHQETKMATRQTQRSTSTISRKIGDCEQSSVYSTGSFSCKSNFLSYGGFCRRTAFETEAQDNSERVFWALSSRLKISLPLQQKQLNY